ncbi:MAG TPA: recombination regulator RecX [Chlorobaculum parvum]|uniref:Regulatory protein RecX n=1 Tax=Chlorobaculum parvum TaxID=274539 RepID=A0A7C5DGR2_9CHLB|nr:recombination regulator RecX [Chlorobaculum parvum]
MPPSEDKSRKAAFNCAVRLLSARDHGRAELENKLKKKRFTQEAIASVMERLGQLNLLDDRTFAGSCMAGIARRRPEGKFKTRARLKQKGLSDAIIEETIASYDQSELCRTAAERKLRTLNGPPETIRKKLYTFLKYRGFDWATIRETVNTVISGEEPGRSA